MADYFRATSLKTGEEHLTTSKAEHVRLLASGYRDTTGKPAAKTETKPEAKPEPRPRRPEPERKGLEDGGA